MLGEQYRDLCPRALLRISPGNELKNSRSNLRALVIRWLHAYSLFVPERQYVLSACG